MIFEFPILRWVLMALNSQSIFATQDKKEYNYACKKAEKAAKVWEINSMNRIKKENELKANSIRKNWIELDWGYIKN